MASSIGNDGMLFRLIYHKPNLLTIIITSEGVLGLHDCIYMFQSLKVGPQKLFQKLRDYASFLKYFLHIYYI